MSPENRQSRESGQSVGPHQQNYTVELKSREGKRVTVHNALDRDFLRSADALVLSLREDRRKFAGRE